MKNSKIPQRYPDATFTPSEQNEKQEIKGLKYNHIYKSSRGKSHIYERYIDGQSIAALRIDGPSDGSIVLDHKGNIKLLTGEKTLEKGPSSGKLFIKTWGRQELNNERVDVQYNAADDSESVALNVLSYGDIVEENRGSERVIRASKIVISADTELIIRGDPLVLQSGEGGGGKIIQKAGIIESDCVSSIENISGQKLIQNFSEFTLLSTSINSSCNFLLAGHFNATISGNWSQKIKGWYNHVVVGKSLTPVSHSYNVRVLRGKSKIENLKGSILIDGKRGFTLSSYRNIKVESKRNIDLIPARNLNVTSIRDISFNSRRIKFNSKISFDVKSVGRLNMASNAFMNLKASKGIGIRAKSRVRIKGSTIYLN